MSFIHKFIKKDLIDKNDISGYTWVKNCLIKSEFIESGFNDEIWHGSQFAQRALTPYTTTWSEQKITEEKLDYYMEHYKVSKESVIFDLGCGDGRITNYLLRRGYENVVAVDYEKDSILRLRNNHPDDNFLPLASDIFNLPFCERIADVVIAWALFTSTPDFSGALDQALKLLKPEGLLINAEPLQEHALLYSLIRKDPEEFCTIAETSTRARMWDQKDLRYTIHSWQDLIKLMNHPSLRQLSQSGISIFPSLVFGGLAEDINIDEEKKEKLWIKIKDLSDKDIQVYRQIIFVSQKR